MRLKSERELLDPMVRKQVIDDILTRENQQRKQDKWKGVLVYKDQTRRFVIEELLRFFDTSTVQSMDYSISNISVVKKIVDKLARVYSHGVKREVTNNEQDTDNIQQIEKKLDLNTKYKTTNRFLKLNRNIAMYIKPIPFLDDNGEKKFTISVQPLNAYLYDVIEDFWDRTQPLGYILSNFEPKDNRKVSLEPAKEGRTFNTPQPPPKGDATDQTIADTKEDEDIDKSEFIFWTDNYHFTCNEAGEILDKQKEVVKLEGEALEEFIANPIKEKPFANFAIDQDNSFWAEGGSDLIDGGVLVNSMITNLNHIGVMQGYGQFWMRGKNLPRNIQFGPDKAIILEYEDGDPIPEAGFMTSNPPLAELRQSIEMYVALMLTTNNLSTSGVSMDLSSGNPASGIAMMIDKSESQEDVQDQQQVFRDNEPEVLRKISKWIEHFSSEGTLDPELEGLALSENFEDDFQVTYGLPQTIVSETERLTNIEKRKTLGINKMVDLIMIDNPGMSEEQAEQKLQQIMAEKMQRMLDAQGKMQESSNENEEQESHRHQLPSAGMTGPATDVGNGLHTHSIPGNGETEPAAEGPGHTHRLPDGGTTGEPVGGSDE